VKLVSFIFCYFSIVLNIYAFIKSYGLISNIKIKINFFNFFVLLLLSFIEFFSNYYFSFPLNFAVSLLVIFLTFFYFYKDNLLIMLFKLFIFYLSLSLIDLLVSIVFLFFPVYSFEEIGNISFLKGLCTVLVSLLFLLIFSIDSIINIISKLLRYLYGKNNFIFLIISFLTFVVSFSLYYSYARKIDVKLFWISFLLISFVLMLCLIMIFQYFKAKQREDEQQALLNLMNEYEKILDSDRTNRHEMLNNLITLKTYKNKSSEDYEKLIDGIIKDYQIKKSEFYSKLYNLPSGVKGIIYYKIANIKDKDINVELVIAKAVKDKFENLNSRLYFRVCKILGIIIDNAIEAASEAMDKNILIDIYLEDENIIFYIENSFSSNIDLDRITEKGESSKGSNRGYGLFIASKLIKEKDDVDLEQHIDNKKFISILTIKNP